MPTVISGTFVDQDGQPLSGLVRFRPTTRHPSSTLRSGYSAKLDGSGAFSITLPSTSDPVSPVPFSYEVQEETSAKDGAESNYRLDTLTGATLNLRTVARNPGSVAGVITRYADKDLYPGSVRSTPGTATLPDASVTSAKLADGSVTPAKLGPGVATLASPALTGNPTAPTPALGDSDGSIATTGFIAGALATRVPFSMRPSGSRVRGAVFTADKSNGSDTGVNTRTAHRSPSDTNVLSVGWTNYAANGSTGETTADIGPLTIRAAVEYPAGSFWPLRFNGKRDVVVEPGGYIVSDDLAVPGGIPANAWYWVRSYVTVTAGQKWPNSSLNGGTPWSEAAEHGTTQTDKTTSGTIVFGGTKPIRPSVVRSRISSNALSLIGLGDSIICGVGDVDGSRGWFYYATDGVCHAAQMGCSGEMMQSYTGGGMQTRLSLVSSGANAAIIAFVNDMSNGANLATLQTRAMTLWKGMQNLGLQSWHATMTPTGVLTTDAYATTANQTVIGTNATRISFNNWLRDGAPIDPATKAAVAVGTAGALRAAVYSQTGTLVTGASGSGAHLLTGVVEFADAVESARNSGLWKPGGTLDGTHPVQSLHQAMGAAVPIAAMRSALGVTG